MFDHLMMKLAAGAISGVLVGFSLGLVGGGGSVLAVPLLVYFVGVPEPHVAIGSSAVAVAVNALISLLNHARAGTIKWRCASVVSIHHIVRNSRSALARDTLFENFEPEISLLDI